MTKSHKILAGLLGVGIGLAGLTFAAVNGTARAIEAGQPSAIAAERIEAAFAAVPQQQPAPAIEAAAHRIGKGDLFAGRACAEQKWPDISSDCPAGSSGTSLHRVRTVTVGYQDGEATTVLVRSPAPQIAAR